MDAAVRAYQNSSTQVSRDQLITDHLPNVRHILGRMLVSLPDSVDRENLEAAGVLGLVEAAHHFDPSRNVEFGAFAYHRIRGAIIDELRRNCPLPQQMLEKWARIRQVMDDLEGPSTIEDLAERSGFAVEEIEDCLDAVRLTRPETWQEEFGLAQTESLSVVEHQDRAARLAAAIEQLSDRLRIIVGMYYRDDLRLKEIGEVLGLSESRVSRLLQKAHVQLKLMLKDDFED
ncbi:MAG: sigma-70 family RNA polymerase sigma factor [Planctomycetaceae bacterium]